MVEIASEEVQRAKYRQGVTDAIDEVRLSDIEVAGLPIDAGTYTARELGLLLTNKSWSRACENAYNGDRYLNAMDEATEVFTPAARAGEIAGEREQTTLWERGVAKVSNADWVTAIQERGVSNYQTAMGTIEPGEDFPRSVQSYSAAMGDVRAWLTNLTMPDRFRSPTFNVERTVNRNMERSRAVALGLSAQSRGQDVPAVAEGNPNVVTAPDVASMRTLYRTAFVEYSAMENYEERFAPAGIFEAAPDWQTKTLARADSWRELGDDVNRLNARWNAGVGAVSEEEFIGEATSEAASERYRNAFRGENLTAATERYMAGFAPYRNALEHLEFPPELAPAPPGSEQNMARAEAVVGLMKNTYYTGYGGAPDAPEFTFYGEGPVGQFLDWYDDILDEFPWI